MMHDLVRGIGLLIIFPFVAANANAVPPIRMGQHLSFDPAAWLSAGQVEKRLTLKFQNS